MRKLLECELDFWNGFSLSILLDAGFVMVIEDGKIIAIGKDDEGV